MVIQKKKFSCPVSKKDVTIKETYFKVTGLGTSAVTDLPLATRECLLENECKNYSQCPLAAAL